MDFIDRLKSSLRIRVTVDPSISDMVKAFEQEASWETVSSVDRLPTAQAMLARPRTEWPEFVAASLQRIKAIDEEQASPSSRLSSRCWSVCLLLNRLLDEQLPFTEERLAGVLDFCAWNIALLQGRVRLDLMVRQIKPFAAGASDQVRLARAVMDFAVALRSTGPSGVRLGNSVERLLASKGTKHPTLVSSAWSEQVKAAAQSEQAREGIAHALSAANKAKPGKAFLTTARKLIAGEADLADQVMAWIELYVPDPQAVDPNEDAIRGLIWMLSTAEGGEIASRLGRYCELCFKKIPNVGARSTKLGNAAIQALAEIGNPHAIAELTRLKTRVRYPVALSRIGTALADLGSRLNVGAEELEEMALPTYELSADGERRLPAGEGAAIIRLTGTRDVTLTFTGPNGREVASPPKALKDAAPEAVAAARALRKEIEATLAGQSARIERLYLSSRTIPYEQWRERYARHPLVAGLTQRLIWCFRSVAATSVGLPRADGSIADVDGTPIRPGSDASVTLWHPILAEAAHVLAWRRRLTTLGITQPFKQAHREIYVLTDAERQTETYSNRFAAHVIRQHQFKALCDQRGWRYHLMGDWDSHNTPTRLLPDQHLAVEFWVNPLPDAETTPSGIYTLIATDQVRFHDGEHITLASVPPLLFSELMRDVDLFVGVASVGNDPGWADGGPRGAYQTYWTSYAFGALSQSAKTRAEVLAELLPTLVIADRCELSDRFLVVRGKLRAYKIHLGSANIQMEPNDQYLCIVPGRGLAEGKVPERLVLPFEGDMTLSIILSKSFMLANDDKITDPSILHQIKRA